MRCGRLRTARLLLTRCSLAKNPTRRTTRCIVLALWLLSLATALLLELVNSVRLAQILFLPHAFGDTSRSLAHRRDVRDEALLLEVLEGTRSFLVGFWGLDSAGLDTFIDFGALHAHVLIFIVVTISTGTLALDDLRRLFWGLSLRHQLLFLLFPHILLLLLFALLFQLALGLQRVQLLLNLGFGEVDVLVEVDISAAEAFLNFHELELHPRTQLMQLDGHIRILLLVLVVFWEDDPRLWEVVSLALGAEAS